MMAGSVVFQRVEYSEGDVYDGEWSKDGKRNGKGRLKMATGAEYAGMFRNGFFEGAGVMSFRDGSRYEGNFELGRYHGHGVYTAADNIKYEGQFQQGKVKGLGLITLADGTSGDPRAEGKFEGLELVQRCSAEAAVHAARQSARRARDVAHLL